MTYKLSLVNIFYKRVENDTKIVTNGKMQYDSLIEIKYDAAGNLIKKESTNGALSGSRSFYYKYDSMGNVIEELVYNSDALLDLKVIYTYDSTGKMTEKKYFEKTDFAGVGNVGTAAEFDGTARNVNNANGVAVFFTEESHCAHSLCLINGHFSYINIDG